jgi:hypothetical protein
VDFIWNAAEEHDFGDGRTVHTDFFTGPNGCSLTIQGLTSNTYLAVVSGSSGTGDIMGYIQSGSFSDSVSPHSWNSSVSVNGRQYDWVAGNTVYYADLASSTVKVASVYDT